jgi:hypothetical protein
MTLFYINGVSSGMAILFNLTIANLRSGIAICGSTGKSGVRTTLGWRFSRLGWDAVFARQPTSNAMLGANSKHAVEFLRQSVLIFLLINPPHLCEGSLSSKATSNYYSIVSPRVSNIIMCI